MTSLIATPLASGAMFFGESPRYYNDTLYLSDMTGKKIYTINPTTGEKQVLLEVENQPNGMCFAADGSLIYSSMFDGKLYRLKDGKTVLYADLNPLITGYCGDMVIDRHGRVYIDDTGARVLHGETPRAGRLLVVDNVEKEDGTRDVRSVAEDAIFPNALFIDNTGEHLYLAETFAHRLNRFTIGSDESLSERIELWSPSSLPKPQAAEEGAILSIDGGCMDAEGGIWLSMMAFKQFVRIDQEKRVTHVVDVDGDATACTLGGEDGRTLFLVVNKVPEGEGLLSAMVGRRTRCSVWTVRVEVGRGGALP
ncbi:hypothetical protein BJY04DRAFT_153559 [Aspergillus karnatakaensis]|uniref:SMP-30/gluconolactonase/LRE family protein n=1 Tax=Aspergillus karnatakaensis TaxID=1810916 RepID=UPI003CCC9252